MGDYIPTKEDLEAFAEILAEVLAENYDTVLIGHGEFVLAPDGAWGYRPGGNDHAVAVRQGEQLVLGG